MWKQIFLWIVIVGCVLSVNGQESEVYGKINMTRADSFITLKAQIQNNGLLHKGDLNYNFVAVKKGKSGNYSNNKQSGEFSLKPQEQKLVSKIRVNLTGEEELKVYLFIKHKRTLLSKDSLWILPKNRRQGKIERKEERSFFIKGVVIDEAITKIGKDFYDYFYQGYLLAGKKYPFIIKIKEKPGLGRSSIISVEVEDTLVHQFYANPREEFLKVTVKTTLARLHLYEKQRRELLKNNRM